MHAALDISQFVAQAFVAGLWQGLVLIAAVAVLLRFVPSVSAAVRFAVWGFVFALVAALPLLHLPAVSILQPHASSAMVHLGAGWGVAIAALWAIFMLVRGVQLLQQTMHLHRIWKQARPVSPLSVTTTDDSIHALLERSGRPAVELCTSGDVDSPSVIGFFSPRLLIPEWLFAKLAPSDLRQIVLHECEHLRRRDDWFNLLQKVALALFPLNPALLWVDRRLSLERELACDAGVIASTTAPFAYAHCLTRLAEFRLHRRSVALSLSAWSRQSELARRVHHLLRPARNMSRLQARFSMALICLGLGVGAVQMARAPRLFSFTDGAISVGAATAPLAEVVSPMPHPAAAPALGGPALGGPALGSPELPVVYRQQAQQPKAVMMNAVFTPQKPHRSAHNRPFHATFQHKNTPPTRANTPATRPARQPRVILTTLEMHRPVADINPGFSDLQPIQFSPSYAAVSFGDGWLVIQL